MGVASEGPHYRKEKIMDHTFNISFRYCDERDYRKFACGVQSEDLASIVSHVAVLTGVEDIRISYDTCYTEFKLFTL